MFFIPVEVTDLVKFTLYTKIGHYAFILGVIIAVLAGLASGANIGLPNEGIIALLMVFGAVVGGLNIGTKEVTQFLVAVIAIAMAGMLAPQLGTFLGDLGPYLYWPLKNIVAFAVPAGIIVALKTFYTTASTPAV